MKKLYKSPVAAILIVSFLLAGLGLTGPSPAVAATTPSLGAASIFGILSSTFTRNIGITAITGSLGYTTLSGSGCRIQLPVQHMWLMARITKQAQIRVAP